MVSTLSPAERAPASSGDAGRLRLTVVAPPAIHTTRWCEYFRGLGWHVDWISYGFPDDEAVGHLPQLNMGRFSSAKVFREGRRLRRLLADLGPDLVHAHWFTGPAWLMTLVPEVPFLATAWGSDVFFSRGRSPFRRVMARRVGRAAFAVTCDSESLADALVELGVPRRSIRRMIMGPQTEVFSPRPRRPELLRRLGVDNDDPVVLSLRGVDDVYEPETVLRGFAQAVRETPCNLLFRVNSLHIRAAAGVSNAERRWERLRTLVSALGVADRVFPYESVARDELADLLSSSDVFVSVPNSDGTSVALLEALFCEVPVVASELPANREWIPDDAYGSVVRVGDTDALARAIVATLADLPSARERARRAGERARPRADGPTQYARIAELSFAAVDARRSRR